MPSINLDLDYPDHPKTKRLVAILGRGSEAIPIRIWCYCAKYHKKDGSLADYSPAELEALADWRGTPGKALAALLRVGFLDSTPEGIKVHDWEEHAGHLSLYHEAAKAAANARWAKRAPKKPTLPADAKKPKPQSDPQCEPHSASPVELIAPAVQFIAGKTKERAQALPAAETGSEKSGTLPGLDEPQPQPEPKPKRGPLKTGPIAAFSAAWAERYGVDPVLTGRDVIAANAALKQIPEDERIAVCQAYLEAESPWLLENRHPLRGRPGEINRLRTALVKRPAIGTVRPFVKPPRVPTPEQAAVLEKTDRREALTAEESAILVSWIEGGVK